MASAMRNGMRWGPERPGPYQGVDALASSAAEHRSTRRGKHQTVPTLLCIVISACLQNLLLPSFLRVSASLRESLFVLAA